MSADDEAQLQGPGASPHAGDRSRPRRDAEAVEQVLRYYEGYINKLCTRTLYDEYGNPYVCLDKWMKHHLENKLIQAIVGLG